MTRSHYRTNAQAHGEYAAERTWEVKEYLRDNEALAASAVVNSHVQPAAEEVLVHLRQKSKSAAAYR